MPTLEQQLADAIKAQNDLTQAVALYKSQIDRAVADQKAAYDGWRAGAALSGAIVRSSKNQIGTVTGGQLDGFAISGAVPQTFSVIKTVETGISWASRDATDREWLSAMGLEGVMHFQPNFNIVKCVWSGAKPEIASWMFFQQGLNSSVETVACYAKKVSGDCYGGYFNGITDKVKLCGFSSGRGPLAYYHPHPFVGTPSGEVHFALLASVRGEIPLDKPSNWGFFPSLWASHSNDQT